MEEDLKTINKLMDYFDKYGNIKQSAHIKFDFFRISPILCNLSFSAQGISHLKDNKEKMKNMFQNFFLDSIGATITEFKDVKFRFALFQKQEIIKTWEDLQTDAIDHYKMQALRQVYVLILGLDVIGNPFGLVTDFTEGLTSLFYEPLLGYLTQSNEINPIELHMGQKVKETVNKTISSAAGSASLITGSIGRVLATITFDKEFKRVSIVKTLNIKKKINFNFF